VLRGAASIGRLRDTRIGVSPAGATARHGRRRRFDPPTTPRIGLLAGYRAELAKLDSDEKRVTREFAGSYKATAARCTVCGHSTVRVAELSG
jgi:hypothetical protein